MNARPVLYELSAKADRRFSPFCWKARMALAHKGLTPDYVPVGFTDKKTIAFSGQDRVPVLLDKGVTVSDSWSIACYLEDSYPSRPSLFGSESGRSLTRFVDLWATRAMFPVLVRLVLCDLVDHLDAEDEAYIRQTREKQLGVTFEQLAGLRVSRRAGTASALTGAAGLPAGGVRGCRRHAKGEEAAADSPPGAKEGPPGAGVFRLHRDSRYHRKIEVLSRSERL